MELMTSLLLFALTLLPQTFGKSKGKFSYDIGSNSSTFNQHKINHNIVFNTLPPIGKVSDLQSVFIDFKCKNCINCMERAIRAHRVSNYVVKVKTGDDIQGNMKNEMRRDKRKIEKKTTVKKIKSKRNKLITVFKYVDEGDTVYAIKVKESTMNIDNNKTRLDSKCEVFKVEEYYPCETSQANLILKKPKPTKRSKDEQEIKNKDEQELKNKDEQEVKNKDENKEDTPDVTTSNIVVTNKRQIENSQTPEHYMSSVEETETMY